LSLKELQENLSLCFQRFTKTGGGGYPALIWLEWGSETAAQSLPQEEVRPYAWENMLGVMTPGAALQE